MKTETRKVTVEQEVYIAEDGTEFEDLDECEAYETRLIGKHLIMYTFAHDPTDSVEDCWYVKLDTREAVSDFISLCRYEEVSPEGLQEPGVYMYTEGCYGRRNNTWTNIAKIFDILNGGTQNAD